MSKILFPNISSFKSVRMKLRSVYLQRVESALSESSDLLKLHLRMTKNENDGKDESQVPCVFVGFVAFDLVWSLDSVKTLFLFIYFFYVFGIVVTFGCCSCQKHTESHRAGLQ